MSFRPRQGIDTSQASRKPEPWDRGFAGIGLGWLGSYRDYAQIPELFNSGFSLGTRILWFSGLQGIYCLA